MKPRASRRLNPSEPVADAEAVGQASPPAERVEPEVQPLTLVQLRKLFGEREANAGSSPYEEHVRPGHWRKTYGRSGQDRWFYRASKQVWEKEYRPADEIAAWVDRRSLIELMEQLDALVKQVCGRAALGDAAAIKLMASIAAGLINALDGLDQIQLQKLKEVAEDSSTWPVLLSLNPQDIEHAKEHLHRLQVGSKAITPRRPGQRLDSHNFWTRLAEGALKACEDSRLGVPLLEDTVAGVKGKREKKKLWQTPSEATMYELSSHDHVLITDWERRCVGLPLPISDSNFKQWWSAAQFYVLERWHVSKEEYQAALSRISDRSAPKESKKRNLAMGQVRKALRSLVGLRQ